jgi:hypothetical protein
LKNNPVPESFWAGGELAIRFTYRDWDRVIQEMEVTGNDQWHPAADELIGWKWRHKRESMLPVAIELGCGILLLAAGCIYLEIRTRARLNVLRSPVPLFGHD